MPEIPTTTTKLFKVAEAFGPGFQQYAADLVGGCRLVDGAKSADFFNISENNSADVWAKYLTNIKEAGKIGNSMAFQGLSYHIHFVKASGIVATADEMAALFALIGGSKVELYIGSNTNKVLEIDTGRFLNLISGAVTESAGALAISGPLNIADKLQLNAEEIQQGLPPNTEISGRVFWNIPTGVPAVLGCANDTAAPEWVMKFYITGVKVTK